MRPCHLGIVLAAGLLVVWFVQWHKVPTAPKATFPTPDRNLWRMPPLQELRKPEWSTTRRVGMLTLRGYLLVAALLLVVKVVQLAVTGAGTAAG